MGFYDRGYFHDNWSPRCYGPARRGGTFSDWEVWKKLIALNIAVFLLQLLFTRPATEEDLWRSPDLAPDMYLAYEDLEGLESYADEAAQQDSATATQGEDLPNNEIDARVAASDAAVSDTDGANAETDR